MTRIAFSQANTWQGSGTKRTNEDFALIDEGAGCAVLVDGATGLTKVNLVSGETDASWYARNLCKRIAELLGEPNTATADALHTAGTEVAAAYLQLPGANELAREDYPNGSVAVLRWNESELEVTMLGDCTAAVALRDGSMQIVHDSTLDALDKQNYERMFAFATQHKTTMAEARKALNSSFIANRLKMNEPNGYWAADIGCGGFGHELVRRYPIADVSGAFACSDGFAAAVDMGVVASSEELAQRALEGEGPRIADDLRSSEIADKDLLRVHRSKISDDATYVAVKFA